MVQGRKSIVPSRRPQKILNRNQPTEQQGLIFVQQMALALHAIWRPTPNDDYGFDGELELTRDGVVTGYILKAQVKSGPSYMHNKSASGFDFYVSPSDADYWAKTNMPVMLIVCDPGTKQGYWVDVKKYAKEHSEFSETHTIRFLFRSNLLSAESILDISEAAIPDEVDRTEFLIDQIREKLHSNLLPLVAAPARIFEAEYSLRRLADADETGLRLSKNTSGKYVGFADPTGPASAVRSLIDPATVRETRYPEYLRRSGTRNFVIGKWNDAIHAQLFRRGLIQKDKDTYYFPPEEDGSARKLTWESTRGRTPERQVAYPYIGKKSQTTAFWVHHALRAAFSEIGGQYFLRLTPAYVFSHDGKKLIAGKEAGTLTTSRTSKDRNYQVLNHLMFWLWYLAEGSDTIALPIDDTEVVVATTFLNGDANFGIPADKKSLIEIIAADHDIDWSEIEAAAEGETQEDE
jgi:hypothetical protein